MMLQTKFEYISPLICLLSCLFMLINYAPAHSAPAGNCQPTGNERSYEGWSFKDIEYECENAVNININDKHRESIQPGKQQITVKYIIKIGAPKDNPSDPLDVKINRFGPGERFQQQVDSIKTVNINGNRTSEPNYQLDNMIKSIDAGGTLVIPAKISFEVDQSDQLLNLDGLGVTIETEYHRVIKKWERQDVPEPSVPGDEWSTTQEKTTKTTTLNVNEPTLRRIVPGDLDAWLITSNGERAKVFLRNTRPQISSDTHSRVLVNRLEDQNNDRQLLSRLSRSDSNKCKQPDRGVLVGGCEGTVVISGVPGEDQEHKLLVEWSALSGVGDRITSRFDSPTILLREPVIP